MTTNNEHDDGGGVVYTMKTSICSVNDRPISRYESFPDRKIDESSGMSEI